jgi:hypothetical protein
MKKAKKISRILPALLLLLFVALPFRSYSAAPASQQYYEIRIYYISGSSQESKVDAYLKETYIPALHRAGIPTVGVFKPVETDTTSGKRVYVLIPYKTFDQFIQLPGLLLKDRVLSEAGKAFADAEYNDPPYNRQESVLLKAFMNMPEFVAPAFSAPKAERIYELRSYESATESKASKKIEMFNQGGEIALFSSLKFNAAFYGEVLVGSHKPNLMYMITFSDMKSHDDHWNAFRDSPEWKKLSVMEEYKNTVSKVSAYLLHPASYSDF